MSKVSPMFALDAEELFLAGNKAEAIALCEAGIAEYPEYQSGYSLLIRFLSETGNFDKAKEYVETATSYFPNNAKIEEYRKEIDKISSENIRLINEIKNDNLSSTHIAQENSNFEQAEVSEIVESEVEEQEVSTLNFEEISIDEPEATQEPNYIQSPSENETQSNEIKLKKGFIKILSNRIISSSDEYKIKAYDRDILSGLFDYNFYDIDTSKSEPEEIKFISDFDLNTITSKYEKKKVENDDFAKLAEKIKLIKIQPVSDDISQDSEIDAEMEALEEDYAPPATETMANILVMQGAYSKAIDIYRELARKSPDKVNYYDQKIIELEAKVISTLS